MAWVKAGQEVSVLKLERSSDREQTTIRLTGHLISFALVA
jgi:hypothetical protein